jgi:MscS family membrane protein
MRRLVPILGLVLATAACGLPPPIPLPGSSAPSSEETAPDSPRASLSQYLLLCRTERFTEAARFLDIAPDEASEAPSLARHLKTVLDYHLSLDPEDLSPLAQGDPKDQGIATLGTIPLESRPEPVRLVRKEAPDGNRWTFSRATVNRIEPWYGELPDHWVRTWLPPRLLESGPLGLFYWQWIGLPVLVLMSLVLGRTLLLVTSLVLGPLLRRTRDGWGWDLLTRLRGPLTVTYALVVASGFLRRVALHPPAEALLLRSFRICEMVVLVLATLRTFDVLVEGLDRHLADPAARSMLAVLSRAGKAAVTALFAVAILAAFDVPVASVLAGIGIGGLGLALAAQKTVENLFGSFSLAADRAIRVGDTVQIDQLTGTVESIGLRSTRIRTPDRTLVTVPNGKLADARIESLTARDRFRLASVLPLATSTSADALRAILKGFDEILRAQGSIYLPDLSVCLRDIGPYSLNVEVNAVFSTSFEEFRIVRQDVLLAFLDVVKREGSALAIPQTIQITRAEREPEVGKPQGAA